jgi:transcription elongation factor Elf1
MSGGTAGRYRRAVRMRHFAVRNKRRASRRRLIELCPDYPRCDFCGKETTRRMTLLSEGERFRAVWMCGECEVFAREGWFS